MERSASGRSVVIRGPQSFVGGLVLLAMAALALWAMGDLPLGTLRAMGPGLLPRWLAYLVAACGVALVVSSLLRDGDPLESATWRGPLFVCLAVAAFALTIRPFPLGAVTTPGLGLSVAGPLCVLVAGFATDEARPRELLILGLLLTAFSMLLFGDALNLPIPMFPQSATSLFPESWSQKAVLRAIAATKIVLGLFLLAPSLGRRRRRAPIDVARHHVQA